MRLGRLVREQCDGFAAEMFGSVWTEWTPLLFAMRDGHWFRRASMRKVPRDPCVYELVIARDSQRVAVYLGKTRNLRRRLFAYAWRGSHLAPLLQEALAKGWRVETRWMEHKDPRLVEWLMLKRFDYAWNAGENGATRVVGLDAEREGTSHEETGE